MPDVKVTGLAELQRFLDALPAKMEANVMRGATRAGMKVIKDEVVARCPVAEPSDTGRKKYGLYRGALRDSIRLSARSRRGVVTASLKIGGKLKNGADVWYAHLIESAGAVAHIIRVRKGAALSIGGGIYLKTDVLHPGFAARPFVRPAFDTRAGAAVAAAGNYVKRRLATKHGLDTADINVEEQP